MEVLALVRTADEHHRELLAVEELVHYGRREGRGILAEPRAHVRRLQLRR